MLGLVIVSTAMMCGVMYWAGCEESGWRGVLRVLWHQSVIHHGHLVSEEEITLQQLDTSWSKV